MISPERQCGDVWPSFVTELKAAIAKERRSDGKCRCSMVGSILGDGCSICNPEMAREIERENAAESDD